MHEKEIELFLNSSELALIINGVILTMPNTETAPCRLALSGEVCIVAIFFVSNVLMSSCNIA